MKLRYVGIVWLVLRLNAIGQANPNGTIIVVNASQNELVIAADSRENGTHSYDDRDCKISTFGDKFVFVASGRVGLRNHPSSAFWDSHAIAKKEFSRLIRKSTANNLTATVLVTAWGMATKEEIEKRIAHPRAPLLAGLDGNVVVQGLFGRIGKDGHSDIALAKIRYELVGNKALIELADPHEFGLDEFPYFLGRGEAIANASNTQKRDVQTKALVSNDPTATLAIEMVRFTIDYLPPDHTDSNGRPFSVVGYPISAVKLTSKGVEWVEEGNCPQP